MSSLERRHRGVLAVILTVWSVVSWAQAPVSQPPATPQQRAGQLPPLPVTQIDPRDVTLDSPRRLTLTFSEPRPIREILQLLVRGTPFSLAIEPDVDGQFVGELKQLTLREALTTLLSPLGLDFSVQGTVISTFRRRPEMRTFDLDVLNVQRGWQRSVGSGPNGGAGTLTASAPPDDVFAEVAAGIRTLLSESGSVHVDRLAGLAQVSDFPERLDRVGSYLETLHVRSSRQVRVEGRVLEVTLTSGASIDWRAVREKVGLPLDAQNASLGADIQAIQAAIAGQGDIRVIGAPDVTTMNNEPAIMRAGTPGVALLTLTVIPQISADGLVQLSVSPSWEEHREDAARKGEPTTHVMEADTVARVLDGNTVVLSGLLRSRAVMKKASGLSALFNTQQKQSAQAELIVLLRPTIVSPGAFAGGTKD
jgi:MSHA biogenesis protein MshL